jgi:hypothetical protein
MKKQTFANIVNATLFILIKHRDKDGLLSFHGDLAQNVTDAQEYEYYINNFFKTRDSELTDQDYTFYENAANNLIDDMAEKKEQECLDVNLKINDEEHLRKIKKGVKILEKLNWKLGIDYSFKDGDFFMSAKNKKKLREILNK